MADSADRPDQEEQELIRRAAGGDRPAFSRLVLAYQGSLRAFCARFGPDPESADDVAQEALLRAYQGLRRFEIGTDFGKWLRGIARHLLQDALRRAAREARVRRREGMVRTGEGMARRLAVGESGEDTAARLDALTLCIESLEEGSRRLVRSHYEEGLPGVEISRREGKGLSTVRMQLLRIRRALRRCMALKLKAATR